jgi:alpha-beta hydrolase superfamily lysophospholipase
MNQPPAFPGKVRGWRKRRCESIYDRKLCRMPALQATTARQALSLMASDGVMLDCLIYGPATAEVAVVFGHGFTGTQRNPKVVQLAEVFAGAGMAFYSADFRGHGSSGGLSSLGEHEVLDLEALVVLARRRHRHVVTMGASMGGFVALRHAALHGPLDGTVAISSPAYFDGEVLPRARVLGTLARSNRGRRLLQYQGTRVGSFPQGVATAFQLAPSISPTPVSIVHGRRDRYIPLSQAQALYDQLREPRRLVVLDDFGHGEAGFSPAFNLMLTRLVADLVSHAGEADESVLPHESDEP